MFNTVTAYWLVTSISVLTDSLLQLSSVYDISDCKEKGPSSQQIVHKTYNARKFQSTRGSTVILYATKHVYLYLFIYLITFL
jgi:hypothetical protein